MDTVKVLAFSFGQPGLFEILLVVLILVLFFGARRLPDLARSLGRSIQEFKKGRSEGLKGKDEEDRIEEGSNASPDTEKAPAEIKKE